jgi:glycosyltransferase involved in cell wall biosynthesis
LRYHIPLKNLVELERINRETAINQRPRFDIEMLGQRLGATFDQSQFYSVLLLDKLRSKIVGYPESWALARVLASQLGREDVIFCTGEDQGIPIATLCGTKQEQPKIAVHFHNINRPRGRMALKLFRVAERINLFITHSQAQLNFLRCYLNLPEDRVRFFWHPIDYNFFTPGLPTPNKIRPVIVSVGLEMRDYRLLAAATEKLDVDVKVAGFSQFYAAKMARNFPKTIPDNMFNRSYQLSEIVQLYRDADVVVICLKPSFCSAGVNVLLEAMACRRPIVATRTQGLADYLSDEDAVVTVEPGDPKGLQQAILQLLRNPEEAEARAQRAYEIIRERHSLEKFIEVLAQSLETL